MKLRLLAVAILFGPVLSLYGSFAYANTDEKTVEKAVEPNLPDYTGKGWEKTQEGTTRPLLHKDWEASQATIYALNRDENGNVKELLCVFYSADGALKYAEWARLEIRLGTEKQVIRGYMRKADSWEYETTEVAE